LGDGADAIYALAPFRYAGTAFLTFALTLLAALRRLIWDTQETCMLKSLLGAAAALSLLGAVACTQGPNEEKGEQADTAREQATTGETDLSQGPSEEAGEAVDAGQSSSTTPSDSSTAPTTTP
jgi:hypothetical protein